MFDSKSGTRSPRSLIGIVVGTGLCLAAFVAPGSASAATVKCLGDVTPATKSTHKSFNYTVRCHDSGGVEEMPTKVDAYSIVSTKQVGLFSTEVLVTDPAGEVVEGESFGCEGPFPGFGFGCNGKMSLDNTATGQFELTENPCSKKGRRQPFHAWVTVASDKFNPNTLAVTKTSSEPFRLKTPKCPAVKKQHGHHKHHS